MHVEEHTIIASAQDAIVDTDFIPTLAFDDTSQGPAKSFAGACDY
jgi:hypothetical protein